MSSKRKHNHNTTAEVECLENKTNNETEKQCFSACLLNFFLFNSSSPIPSITLQCWPWIAHSYVSNHITYDRSDFCSAKLMISNASSSIMAIAFSNCFTFVFDLSMSFERCCSCLSVSLLSFLFFLRFKMELIFQM